MVTGASGLVGEAVLRRFQNQGGFTLTGVSSKDVDLRLKEKTFQIFGDLSPKIVIHCAGRVGELLRTSTGAGITSSV